MAAPESHDSISEVLSRIFHNNSNSLCMTMAQYISYLYSSTMYSFISMTSNTFTQSNTDCRKSHSLNFKYFCYTQVPYRCTFCSFQLNLFHAVKVSDVCAFVVRRSIIFFFISTHSIFALYVASNLVHLIPNAAPEVLSTIPIYA